MSVAIRKGTSTIVVRKDEVWMADLGESKGSRQGGERPVLITTNNMGCRYSSVVQAAVITSSKIKKKIPTHVYIKAANNGFKRDSIIMFEQMFPLVKEEDLLYKLFDLPSDYYEDVDKAYNLAASRDYI